MNTIYKYELDVTQSQKLELPSNCNILDLQVQNGVPCLWVQLNDACETKVFDIQMYGTGWQLEESIHSYDYLGTVQIDGFVWHYYIQ